MNKLLTLVEFLLLSLAVASCATVIKGHNEGVVLTTNPSGAECHIERKGEMVGAVSQTPGNLQLGRSKDDITVTCSRAGYAQNTVVYSPIFNGATLGNVLAGGVIGLVVDASTGANYNYPKKIDMTLTPATDVTMFQAIPVSLTSAVNAAEAQGGKATNAVFVRDNETSRYLVTLLADNKLHKVAVDALTGQVTPYDLGAAEPTGSTGDLKAEKAVASAKTGLPAAIAEAEKQGGKAIEAGVKMSDRGKTTYEMRLVDGVKTRTVWVTLATGTVTKKS